MRLSFNPPSIRPSNLRPLPQIPSAEMGIPEGIENFSAATTVEILAKVSRGVIRLQEPMKQLIRDLSPHCIFSDLYYTWTVDLAEELKIPSNQLRLYKIEMKRSQLEDPLKGKSDNADRIKGIKESEFRSFGKDLNKVLYVSFGSLTKFSNEQLSEIALVLEASNHPFIWVVRKMENEQEISRFLDGFEERMKKDKKGLIIRGWAPQLMILNHPAVGGFMTHCGWNSTMEAMSAGVPLITWPLFAEQFYNEKILDQVLKVGVSVGADHWNLLPVIKGPVVESKQIEESIRRLMSTSEESQQIRKRAKKMAALAKGLWNKVDHLTKICLL
ncbi:hypothetical protein ACH5RR_034975 [Cinchona calisaya]|uniref:UDP-glycosyltransferases domain-containing protein n=1 Tax=Cinchona calisaya TaxID=153742 RepID=A0ABD2YGE1_9GENT